MSGPEWFLPKRYGYGSGLPIAWQGWLVLSIYLLVLGGTIALAGDRPAIVAVVGATATGFLLLVSARTTRGGWRWRWGDPD